MTFETLPWPRRHTALVLGLRHRAAGRHVVRLTASGTVGLAAATTTALGCNGTVTIRYSSGSRRLATRKALVGPHCGYSTSARIRYSGLMRVRVRASFSGNTYQAPVNSLRAGETRMSARLRAQLSPEALTTSAMICESWLPCHAIGDLPGGSVISRAFGIASA